MAWQSEGKVKVKGSSVTLLHDPDTGRYATNYGASNTRAGALKMAAAGVQSENDSSERQAREQSAAVAARNAKTVECSACGIRTTNMNAHEKSAKHRNAVAYSEYSRRSRY